MQLIALEQVIGHERRLLFLFFNFFIVKIRVYMLLEE